MKNLTAFVYLAPLTIGLAWGVVQPDKPVLTKTDIEIQRIDDYFAAQPHSVENAVKKNIMKEYTLRKANGESTKSITSDMMKRANKGEL